MKSEIPSWVFEQPVFTVLYSAKHDFLYHPEFHPERAGQVMMTGWRAIVKCEWSTESRVRECILGLSREFVERTARDFARLDCETALAERTRQNTAH